VDEAVQKMDRRFRSWSRRNLSTLGKILIVKTYGISQFIHVLQVIVLTNENFKKVNSCIYKYIWNRHYLAAKAPDRVKREIVNTPLTRGGYGMLDIVQLDNSLKLRALGRLFETKHPMLTQIKRKLIMRNFFEPSIATSIDKISVRGVELLRYDRCGLLKEINQVTDRKLIRVIKNIPLKEIINDRGMRSIPYFMLVRSGKLRIGQLNRVELDSIRIFFKDRDIFIISVKLEGYVRETEVEGDEFLYPSKIGLVSLSTLSSKSIREMRNACDPICIFKIGIILSPNESLSYMQKVRMLTSTRHKNNLLRILHSEVYTNERLFRFGMIDSPICDRCTEIDTLDHRLTNCQGTERLLNELVRLTDGVRTVRDGEEKLDKVLMSNSSNCLASLTLHAEIIGLIISKATLSQEPMGTIRRILVSLIKKESNNAIKNQLKALFEDY